MRGFKLDSTFGKELCTYMEQRRALGRGGHPGQLVWLCFDHRYPRLEVTRSWFWPNWLLAPGGFGLITLLRTLLGSVNGDRFFYNCSQVTA